MEQLRSPRLCVGTADLVNTPGGKRRASQQQLNKTEFELRNVSMGIWKTRLPYKRLYILHERKTLVVVVAGYSGSKTKGQSRWERAWRAAHDMVDKRSPFALLSSDNFGKMHLDPPSMAQHAQHGHKLSTGARASHGGAGGGSKRCGVVVLEVSWDNVQGLDYMFPLHQDGRLVVEAKAVNRRTFHTITEVRHFYGIQSEKQQHTPLHTYRHQRSSSLSQVRLASPAPSLVHTPSGLAAVAEDAAQRAGEHRSRALRAEYSLRRRTTEPIITTHVSKRLKEASLASRSRHGVRHVTAKHVQSSVQHETGRESNGEHVVGTCDAQTCPQTTDINHKATRAASGRAFTWLPRLWFRRVATDQCHISKVGDVQQHQEAFINHGLQVCGSPSSRQQDQVVNRRRMQSQKHDSNCTSHDSCTVASSEPLTCRTSSLALTDSVATTATQTIVSHSSISPLSTPFASQGPSSLGRSIFGSEHGASFAQHDSIPSTRSSKLVSEPSARRQCESEPETCPKVGIEAQELKGGWFTGASLIRAVAARLAVTGRVRTLGSKSSSTGTSNVGIAGNRRGPQASQVISSTAQLSTSASISTNGMNAATQASMMTKSANSEGDAALKMRSSTVYADALPDSFDCLTISRADSSNWSTPKCHITMPRDSLQAAITPFQQQQTKHGRYSSEGQPQLQLHRTLGNSLKSTGSINAANAGTYATGDTACNSDIHLNQIGPATASAGADVLQTPPKLIFTTSHNPETYANNGTSTPTPVRFSESTFIEDQDISILGGSEGEPVTPGQADASCTAQGQEQAPMDDVLALTPVQPDGILALTPVQEAVPGTCATPHADMDSSPFERLAQHAIPRKPHQAQQASQRRVHRDGGYGAIVVGGKCGYQGQTLILHFRDPLLPPMLSKMVRSDVRLLKLYESGLPAWAVFLPSYGLWYRPWLRRATFLLFTSISLLSMLMGFYDLYKNVPLVRQAMAALSARMFPPAQQLFEWLEKHAQVRLSILLTYIFSKSPLFITLMRFLRTLMANAAQMLDSLTWALRSAVSPFVTAASHISHFVAALVSPITAAAAFMFTTCAFIWNEVGTLSAALLGPPVAALIALAGLLVNAIVATGQLLQYLVSLPCSILFQLGLHLLDLITATLQLVVSALTLVARIGSGFRWVASFWSSMAPGAKAAGQTAKAAASAASALGCATGGVAGVSHGGPLWWAVRAGQDLWTLITFARTSMFKCFKALQAVVNGLVGLCLTAIRHRVSLLMRLQRYLLPRKRYLPPAVQQILQPAASGPILIPEDSTLSTALTMEASMMLEATPTSMLRSDSMTPSPSPIAIPSFKWTRLDSSQWGAAAGWKLPRRSSRVSGDSFDDGRRRTASSNGVAGEAGSPTEPCAVHAAQGTPVSKGQVLAHRFSMTTVRRRKTQSRTQHAWHGSGAASTMASQRIDEAADDDDDDHPEHSTYAWMKVNHEAPFGINHHQSMHDPSARPRNTGDLSPASLNTHHNNYYESEDEGSMDPAGHNHHAAATIPPRRLRNLAEKGGVALLGRSLDGPLTLRGSMDAFLHHQQQQRQQGYKFTEGSAKKLPHTEVPHRGHQQLGISRLGNASGDSRGVAIAGVLKTLPLASSQADHGSSKYLARATSCPDLVPEATL